MADKSQILSSITSIAKKLGRAPSEREFNSLSGITTYYVLQHFRSWNDAVRAARLRPYTLNIRAQDRDLLKDWGRAVRRLRAVPGRRAYARVGKYNPGTIEKRFGPWPRLPEAFRNFAKGKPQWKDVVTLLPSPKPRGPVPDANRQPPNNDSSPQSPQLRPRKTWPVPRCGRPMYGNPIDFRGLRHEPVNEQGVVFLFGMLAKELGFLVEAMRVGFPDCEAKRRIAPERWQRVYIEFEFESRNFWNHGHPASGCDVIVCWKHNWEDCPEELEVVELSSVIRSLGNAEDQTEPVGSSQGQKHPTAHDSLPRVTP